VGKWASMKILRTALLALLMVLVAGAICGVLLLCRGFRATSTPSAWEAALARIVRNLAIPGGERGEKNPFAATSDATRQGRESFLIECAACHGIDGSGKTPMGLNLYPRVPDLRADRERGAAYRNARLGESAFGIVGQELETRALHS
jgi:mono/diheme cytochrome c family protein